MRTVSLSNSIVQKKVKDSFVPLKLEIAYGTEKFPLDWPALRNWHMAYFWMGGKKTKGITGCSVVSPDLQIELGNTGSAFVWEMFDSIAYDPNKFAKMLDNSLVHFQRYKNISTDSSTNRWKKRRAIRQLKADLKRSTHKSGKFHLPPRGFTADGAVELFRLSGDLKD